MTETPRYIAVEGPIGVGKTALAERLTQTFSAYLALEAFRDNPFLEKFYLEPEHFSLPTQLFFLLSRVKQVRSFNQADIFYATRITDFLIDKDRLFAELTLLPEQFDLYLQVYEILIQDLIQPDLVIYLQAPVDVLMDRVARRGRHFERGIEGDYLDQISQKYSEFFYHYNAAPLLIVNAAEADFRQDGNDYRQLIERIRSVCSGKYYFNPVAGA